MPDFKFSDLQDLVNALYDPYYLPSNEKIKLAELLEDVLELEVKKSPEKAISKLKNKTKNELKSEVSNEPKQKINTQIQQLQQEKKILETKNEATGQLRKKNNIHRYC